MTRPRPVPQALAAARPPSTITYRRASPWRLALGSLAVASLLAGCGGGGSDAGNAPGAPVAQAPRVQLTSTNAPLVAAEAVSAAGVGDVGGAVLPLFGVQVQTADAAPAPAAVPALVAAARRALTLQAPALVTGVTTTTTIPCSTGSITATITEARTDRPSLGDRFDLVFNGCVEGGERLDGGVSLSLTAVNTALTVFTLDLRATAFTVATGRSSERVDGSLQLNVDDSSPVQTTVRVTAPAITLTRAVGNTVRSTRSVVDFSYVGTIINATGRSTESYGFTGTGSFTALGQVSFVVSTVSPFVTDSAQALRPSSGAARIVGADQRSVLATVVPGGVRLDLDLTGDSAIDETRVLTWAQFDALLGD